MENPDAPESEKACEFTYQITKVPSQALLRQAAPRDADWTHQAGRAGQTPGIPLQQAQIEVNRVLESLPAR